MVLLKNDGVLPLGPSARKIAVVGPLAESLRVLQGNYSGTPSHAATALDGIRKQFAGAQVSFVPGTNFLRRGYPVPTSVLSTPDGKPGLKAEYFSEPTSKARRRSRVDPIVQCFNLSIPSRDRSCPRPAMKNFSVRWTGFLTPRSRAPIDRCCGFHRTACGSTAS